MAADSNMSFHRGLLPSSFYNSHLVSFQSGTTSSTAAMIPGGMYSSGTISSAGGMLLSGNPSRIGNSSAVIPSASSSGNVILDQVPLHGLKHDMGLAADWSFEEQTILREGLVKFANEPTIIKYIKIAALLHDKTVRDVALRCRWMTKKESGKRRKLEESYLGKKIKDRKEQLVASSQKVNTRPVSLGNLASYSQMHPPNNNWYSYEVPAIDDATRNLFEENVKVLNQISANLAASKIQENIDLFYRTRNNISSILISMSQMPGLMSRMPPLPVSMNEDLFDVILPGTSQALLSGNLDGFHSNQDQSC